MTLGPCGVWHFPVWSGAELLPALPSRGLWLLGAVLALREHSGDTDGSLLSSPVSRHLMSCVCSSCSGEKHLYP